MKLNKKKILFYCSLLTLIFGLNSCYDDKMEWGDPYTHPAAADLPLQLQEAISRYEVLKNYSEFILGVGIDLNLYMTDNTYANIVNENFNEITIGYDMKHGAMVNSKGEINFTKVDDLVAKLQAAGLSVYGHTLAWHQNNNAGYLNGLIAPTILPGEAGASLLDVSKLLDGSFTGWGGNNLGGITIVPNAGLSSSDPAIRFEVITAGNEWDTQLISPEIPAVIDHHYRISFWTKSEDAGQWRMSFAGLDNNYPWNGGGALFSTSGTWTQITYEQVAVANVIKIAFDVGKVPGVYYVDINTINVTDLDAAPVEVNYVENGGFESGDLTNWSALNAGAGISVSADAKYTGDYGLQAISSASSTNDWDLQFAADAITLIPGGSYTFSFMIKSDVAGKGRISFPGGMDGNEYPWLNWDGTGTAREFTTSSDWKLISVDVTNTTTLTLQFDLGTVPDVTYFVDDVKVVEKPAAQPSSALRAGPVIIEKTPEEKAQLIGDALESWISQMVSHYKNSVHAWDVVNEPMNDTGGIRSGLNVAEPASDEFYWVDYLGKDYAVTAFNLARQYGNATDKLFINDYGLESASGNKLNGLLEYVKYIEGKGAQIDGIGTQMHLDLRYSSKEAIDQMFQKLAQSDKLIKISELDIQLGTDAPTPEQFAQQAELYQYVVDAYTKYIPAAQRYGITVWCVSDNAKEHENWLPDDAPCLWDKDYARKYAYKGFADGLAGKDVSADFSGELQ
ncbi:MAG: endo-1,4-beta-xylanase [Candidatus Symbiothrix sp.]|jgi:GH35 family endo-1,4-beta-xylanase|nr:endo-1,4-beta-xylanase [Candidatus Symbiothrix sp.]